LNGYPSVGPAETRASATESLRDHPALRHGRDEAASPPPPPPAAQGPELPYSGRAAKQPPRTEPEAPSEPTSEDAPAPEPGGDPASSPSRVVGPLEAVLRHPFLTVIPLLLLVGAALAIGLTRDPVYTAQARINVGRVDVPAYTLQGVTIGNETLAAGYARTISAAPVINRAAKRARVSTSRADSLSASPVPGSTLIRVKAEGATKDEATRIANAGATSLIAYVEGITRKQQENNLLSQFRAARARADRARVRLRGLRAQPNPNAKALRKAKLDVETADLKAASLGDQFRASDTGPNSRNLLQLIAPANAADSDFSSVLQRLILIAVAAGLAIGIALALLRANRRLLRRPRT
jgi:capsular polysaccharide biosynthesis protein